MRRSILVLALVAFAVTGGVLVAQRDCAEPTHVDSSIKAGGIVHDSPVEAARAFVENGGELVEDLEGDLQLASSDGSGAVVSMDDARIGLRRSSSSGWKVSSIARC